MDRHVTSPQVNQAMHSALALMCTDYVVMSCSVEDASAGQLVIMVLGPQITIPIAHVTNVAMAAQRSFAFTLPHHKGSRTLQETSPVPDVPLRYD